MAFVRKVKTGSGATAVQICRNKYGKIEVLKHLGSAWTPETVERLEKKAREIMARGQRSMFDLSRFDKSAKKEIDGAD